MLGVAFSSYIGGYITPVGSVVNVLAMGFAEQALGVTVTFANWMVLGTVTAVVMLPITWFALVKILKPEPISDEALARIEEEHAALPGFTRDEVWGMLVVLGAMVLWVAGSWFPALDIVVVGLVALGLLFLPPFKCVSFKRYCDESPLAGCDAQLGRRVRRGGHAGDGVHVMAGRGRLRAHERAAAHRRAAHRGRVRLRVPQHPAGGRRRGRPHHHPRLHPGRGHGAATSRPRSSCAPCSRAPRSCCRWTCACTARTPASASHFTPFDEMKVGWVPSVVAIAMVALVIPGVCTLMGLQ